MRRSLRFFRYRILPALVLSAVVSVSACAGASPAGSASGPESAAAGQISESSGDDILKAVFFDVGKGDCILFSVDGMHVLVDTGYEETADQILEELKSREISALDAMVITHYDKDHVGGAAEIAGEMPVGTFYLPDYVGDEDKCGDLLDLIEEEDLQAVRVSQEQTFQAGNARFKIEPSLIPYDSDSKNDNDASLIVEVFCGEDSWLLPGDIEEEAIEVWLSVNTQEYDILKIPHHGRKESNTKELIRNVSPSIAVVTDSDEDEASEKVLKKLDKNDVDIYRSSVNGTITITGSGDDTFDVQTEKP